MDPYRRARAQNIARVGPERTPRRPIDALDACARPRTRVAPRATAARRARSIQGARDDAFDNLNSFTPLVAMTNDGPDARVLATRSGNEARETTRASGVKAGATPRRRVSFKTMEREPAGKGNVGSGEGARSDATRDDDCDDGRGIEGVRGRCERDD